MILGITIFYLLVMFSYYFLRGFCEGLEEYQLALELNRLRQSPPPPPPPPPQQQKIMDPMLVRSLHVPGFTEIPTKTSLYQTRRKLMRVYHPDVRKCNARFAYAINDAFYYLNRHVS